MMGLDIASRMEMLKENLGVAYCFGEICDDNEHGETETETNATVIIADDGTSVVTSDKSDEASVVFRSPLPLAPPPPNAFLEDVAPAAVPLDCSKFRVGESSEEDINFCSWKVIQAYPEQFIGKTNKSRAQPYFDKILEGRVWDFFYLRHPDEPNGAPRLLVPSVQFESFLRGINRELGTSLAIPGGANQDRFYMKIGDGGTPKPRYLKRSRDQKRFDIEDWPPLNDNDVNAFRAASPAHQDDWKEQWNMMAPRPAYRGKKKNSERRAAQKKLDRERMLNEAQEYLHLKGDSQGDIVLFCVDVEAIEVSPNPISEVGIAILDTKDIRGIEPGPCGKDWWPFIKSYHLRIREYSGLVNYRFVKGCPDYFDFGESRFPTGQEVAKEIESILEPYTAEGRQLMFVGHDAMQDTRYLSNLGFEVFQVKKMLGQLDTQEIHRAWREADNGRSLQKVLDDLAMPHKNLHNAGNDAVYTLRALIGVAVEQIREQEAREKGEEYRPALWTGA